MKDRIVKKTKKSPSDLFCTLWVIAYFALYAVFVCTFLTHKTDITVSSICVAGIVGHTVMLGYAIIIAADFSWPWKLLYSKYGSKGFEAFKFNFVALAIGVILLILEIIWCILLKSNGMLSLKYLFLSLVMVAIDVLSLRFL